MLGVVQRQCICLPKGSKEGSIKKRTKQGWRYKKGIQTRVASWDNKVHVTSLLLFTEIPLLEKQQGCNIQLSYYPNYPCLHNTFFVLPSLLHPQFYSAVVFYTCIKKGPKNMIKSKQDLIYIALYTMLLLNNYVVTVPDVGSHNIKLTVNKIIIIIMNNLTTSPVYS